MYILARGETEFYVVGCDSYGYTVTDVVNDPAKASQFATAREALDIKSELDDYWRDQCRVTL